MAPVMTPTEPRDPAPAHPAQDPGSTASPTSAETPSEAGAILCVHCGYDLSGLSAGLQCPECGGERAKKSDSGYGNVAGRGLLWTLPNLVASKILAVAAQFILAWMLTQHDFGVYGIALSIVMFVQNFRDGGVRELLIQQPHRYDELCGSAFWLAALVNVAVGLFVGIAGELVGLLYVQTGFLHHRTELSSLVWIMAASVPLSTVSAALGAKMRIDMDFKGLAIMTTGSSFIRYGGQIGLAMAGVGPMSIVIPMVVMVIYENFYTYFHTRARPWARPAEAWRWRGMLRDSKWIVLSTAAMGITNQGYALAAGLFMPASAVGVYFFAVQLLMQVETLIASTLMQIMFPILARLNHDPRRQGEAAIRVTRSLMLLTAPMCLGLVAVYPQLELIFFNGKWADAFWPLAILALAYPLRGVFVCVPSPLVQAQGRFRDYFNMWAFNGAGLVVATALGAFLFRTPEGVAASVGLFMAAACTRSTIRVLREVEVPRVRTLVAMTRVLLWSAAIAAVALVVDMLFTGPWIDHHIPGQLNLLGRNMAYASGVRVFVTGVVFTIIYASLVRLIIPAQIIELLSVIPARLAAPVRRVLRLA